MARVVLSAIIALLSAPAFAQDATPEQLGAAIGGIIGILILAVFGAVIGWLAGLIVKGHGSGLLGNIAAGIGGSIVAGRVLPMFGIPVGGTFGAFIAALVGAVALILIVRLIRKAAN